jgi:hypothetical protein
VFGLADCRDLRFDSGWRPRLSHAQEKLLWYWNDFWRFARNILKKPYAIVHVGDVIDNSHHGVTSLLTHNIQDQEALAIATLEAHIGRSKYYVQIRGTESHSGESAQSEERIARYFNAIREETTGQYSRWEYNCVFNGLRINFAHHIGGAISPMSKATPLMREMTMARVNAARTKSKPPDLLIRGHVHYFMNVNDSTMRGMICPGWQLKTPYVYRRIRTEITELGGIILISNGKNVNIIERVYQMKY